MISNISADSNLRHPVGDDEQSLLDVVDVLKQDNEQGVTDIDTHPGYLEVPVPLREERVGGRERERERERKKGKSREKRTMPKLSE